ncbi:MAG: calcium-binding protein [Arenibacterium sp.]
MATDILNVTFDGINDVPRLDGQNAREFFVTPSDGSFMDTYNIFHSVPGNDLDATANFTGSNWTIRFFRIAGEDHVTTIRDLDEGTGRKIDLMTLGYNSDVDLITTRVDFMFGWEGEKHDINLGEGTDRSVQSIHVFADLNIINTGSRYVGSIKTNNGDNVSRITVNEQGADSIVTGNGNDRIVINEGFVQSVRVNHGNDTVVLRDGGFIRSLDINNGNDRVTVNKDSRITSVDAFAGNKTIVVEDGGRIDQIRGGDGEAMSITLKGQARVETITAYNTGLTVETGDRFLQTIKGFDANTDLKIGSGGVGNIRFGGSGENKHKLVADGFVGAVDLDDQNSNPDDNQSSNLTFKFFFGNVRLGEDRDVVKAVGADAWGESISTNGGNDRVELDNIGAGYVHLGAGKDVISVQKLTDDDENNFYDNVQIKGGAGIDTILFNKFGGKVTFSLANSAGAQEISGNSRAFQVNGIENLTGGGKNDDLTGNAGNNVIKGLKGADRITGLEGNDLLIGAGGADVFVFGEDAGTDRIRGFQKGTDKIEIADHAGGFRSLDISRAGNNLEIDHDGGTIVLLGRGGANLSGNDFDFV